MPVDALTMPSGGSMPLLGFGTWQIKGDDAVRSTAEALEVGYRHLDTATVYENEAEVGRALADSGVDRGDVFVTTKCPGANVGKERETLERSLEALRLDHVDLWLIHWPTDDRRAMWEALLAAQQDGLVRDIGVSNFDATMIDEVTDATDVRPAVNQIEWSPLLHDPAVIEAHRQREVVVEGYSALRTGALDDPTIRAVAQDLGRTPAQVIIRWHLQHGIVVIPKSATPARIRENADVAGFELSDDAMARLDALGR